MPRKSAAVASNRMDGSTPAAEAAQRALAAVPDVAIESVDPAILLAWKTTADELIRSGVTSKDPGRGGRVLAEHAAGTSRSTIGRRLAIHDQTCWND
jgi:hypothetical protein